MKSVIIIHGCPGNEEKARDPEKRTYDKHWQPWLKQQLTSQGITVAAPLLPEPWSPDYKRFKEEFEKLEVNEDSVLVGHSCGCAFLVRWLGESKQKIAKLILVAPWKIPEKESEEEFYNYPIDETIKDRVSRIAMFTADDEDPEGKESLKIFHGALGGKIVSLPGHGHYCESDMGTTEFPELLAEIL